MSVLLNEKKYIMMSDFKYSEYSCIGSYPVFPTGIGIALNNNSEINLLIHSLVVMDGFIKMLSNGLDTTALILVLSVLILIHVLVRARPSCLISPSSDLKEDFPHQILTRTPTSLIQVCKYLDDQTSVSL